MLGMENPEEVLLILDRYRTLKQKSIPKELDEYLSYVAKTGDPVYSWPTIQYLFREKLTSVIREFHDTTPSIEDLPPCPNVDAFNYENLKTVLLERLDLFHAAPFTVQRLCELLTNPKKHYCRLDKFMRALEKNILVVSTIEPGRKKPESENGDSLSLDVSLDSDIERDIAGPASSAAPSTDSKEDSEANKDEAVAGQSTKSDADDSIADDGDVEVKDSLESMPIDGDLSKDIEVDDDLATQTEEKIAEDIQIDVVDDIKEKLPVAEPVVSSDNNTSEAIVIEEVNADNSDEAEAIVVEESAVVAEQPEAVETSVTDSEPSAVVDSSVLDAEPVCEVDQPIAVVGEVTAESSCTAVALETESSDAISSTVSVEAAVPTETVPTPVIDTAEAKVEEEKDDVCKPSSPKMARLDADLVDAVDTTSSAVVESVTTPEVVSEVPSEPSNAEVPSPSSLVVEPSTPEVEEPTTSTETSSSIDAIAVTSESSDDVSTSNEADSTEIETKTETEPIISNVAEESLPPAEPVLQAAAIESSDVAIEADPEVPMTSEVSAVDIPEVMAVEEDATTSPAADSTAHTPAVAIISQLAEPTEMEATPIIPSDEQMDVDEANSADSMDL